jgi:hypothetical protein
MASSNRNEVVFTTPSLYTHTGPRGVPLPRSYVEAEFTSPRNVQLLASQNNLDQNLVKKAIDVVVSREQPNDIGALDVQTRVNLLNEIVLDDIHKNRTIDRFENDHYQNSIMATAEDFRSVGVPNGGATTLPMLSTVFSGLNSEMYTPYGPRPVIRMREPVLRPTEAYTSSNEPKYEHASRVF